MLSRSEQWHRAILDLLHQVNLCQPDRLPDLVASVTSDLTKEITIYLVDHEQRHLRPFGAEHNGQAYPVEGSIAGLAYQRGDVQIDPADRRTAWVPLLDSTERLGVVRVMAGEPISAGTFTGHDPDVQFAHLLGHLVAAKTPYGDTIHRLRSTRPMTTEAVLLRQLLPPSTFTCDRLVLAASLQPAYSVGGDAFDYAVDGDNAFIGIYDGIGHGLGAGMAVAVVLSAVRAARRNGEGLAAMALEAGRHLQAQFGEAEFVTAVLLQLDLSTGRLTYVCAGHPRPVVLRRNGDLVHLHGGQSLPLGLAQAVTPAADQLLEGDRLLFYTDGLLEARGPDAEFFGQERLVSLAHELTLAEETAPETARRINEAVAYFHAGEPDDDATVVVADWSSTAAAKALP